MQKILLMKQVSSRQSRSTAAGILSQEAVAGLHLIMHQSTGMLTKAVANTMKEGEHNSVSKFEGFCNQERKAVSTKRVKKLDQGYPKRGPPCRLT